jgi:hypothetical protein
VRHLAVNLWAKEDIKRAAGAAEGSTAERRRAQSGPTENPCERPRQIGAIVCSTVPLCQNRHAGISGHRHPLPHPSRTMLLRSGTTVAFSIPTASATLRQIMTRY